MTALTGWPGAPGVPMNPEQSGWHWLARGRDDVWPFWWVSGEEDGWCAEEGCDPDCADTDPERMARYWPRYLGPCLLPAEVLAREAAAAEAMREAIAQQQMCGCEQAPAVTLALTAPGKGRHAAERLCGLANCCAVISAEILETPLPAPDALARIEAAAEARGMEKAAAPRDALRWATALQKIQQAAAAALEHDPNSELFALLHRTAAQALALDAPPENEALAEDTRHG